MSEKEECVLVRKNFSPREWIMLIIILGFIEAGVLIASHRLMSSSDVLNYISFASTIASLLLAVLAIVYGFYQSESQKRSGDGVDMHLSHLRTTADQIRAVSTTLSENSSGVIELSTSLRNLNDALHVTQNKLSAVEGSVNGFSKQQESFGISLKEMRVDPANVPAVARETLSESITDQAAKVVLGESGSIHIRLVAVAIAFAFEKRGESKIAVNDIGSQIVTLFLEERLYDWSLENLQAAVVIAFVVLQGLDVVEYSLNESGVIDSLKFNAKKRDVINVVEAEMWKIPERVELLGKLKKSMQELSPEKSPS